MGLPLIGNKHPGFRSFLGTWLSPGAQVTFLGPAGVLSDSFTEPNRVSTLNAALARIRPSKGDVILALPGYAETVSAADYASSLVAGTTLIGLPGFNNSQMPTLTFSATTSTILLDVADTVISGFKFVPSIDAVANYVTVSASGCKILDCVFNCGTSSSLDVVNPVIVNPGSDDFEFAYNRMFSTSTAVTAQGLAVNGVNTANGISIHDNDFDLSISGATGGVIEWLSAAATPQARIYKNIIRNRRAAAAVGIRLADVAGADGVIYDNYFTFAADVTVVGGAISAAGSSNHTWRAIQNFGIDENAGTALVGGIGTGTIE